MNQLEDELGNCTTTEVELVSYVKNRETGTSEARYYVRHSNQTTVLEQGLVISRDQFGYYKADLVITDFPKLGSAEEAALKLAAWLKRMGEAIESSFNREGGEA
ncbi:hypothetical protein Dpoa569_0001272 [Dickeya poaceiphila]|uniref:Uncharacterized protein n=1 Tax=Dickeya poaceiphila TaxID=568768 RepID=A0A5B8ICR5_9GAMM|nr:hypothetical protein Dpoa569_0001272 [Dickeya poaceiphila]